MNTAYGPHTAGTAARRARRQRGTASAAAAVLLLVLACAAWALPGALATDALAAAAAQGDGAGPGSPAAAAGASLPQISFADGVTFAFFSNRIIALPGSTFAITVAVANTGQGDLKTKQAVLRVWSQDSASFPARACEEVGNASAAVPAIPAHFSSAVYVPGIPAPSVVGTYTLRVFLDADCKVAEGDNSLAVHQLTADYQVVDPSTALPALGVYAGVRTPFKAGKQLKVLLALFNFGAVASPPGVLALIVSNHTDALTTSCEGLPEAGGVWTTSNPSVTVPAGGFLEVTASVALPSIKGQLALHAVINADCSIAEDTSIDRLGHYMLVLLTI